MSTETAELNALSGERRMARTDVIRWLRKTHGWIGLWGATLGLLFGTTGVLLNHRAQLKIPVAAPQESTAQLDLGDAVPTDPEALTGWLRQQLALQDAPARTRVESARPVAWGDHSLRQPAHWMINFSGAREGVQADWWSGNRFVTVKRSEQRLLATLNNLHKGVGGGTAWILLADTLAGSIVLLSLTGVVLWTQLNRRRVVGATIAITSLVVTIVLAVQAL